MIVINAGSENKGGTIEQAKVNANDWLLLIHSSGFVDVELLDEQEVDGGMWAFTFRHGVTKKAAKLTTHGFTDDECLEFTFSPREYWNGSSLGEPSISDWQPDGWTFAIKYQEGVEGS